MQMNVFIAVFGFTFTINLANDRFINQGDDSTAKIFNGDLADIKDFPFMVSLQFYGRGHMCGGFVITPAWVVTAAHCVYGHRSGNFFVLSGIKDLDNWGKNYRRIDVYSIVIHPLYRDSDNPNDIALLRLNSDLHIQDKVGRAVFPRYTDEMEEMKTCTVIGWGKSTKGERYSPLLRKSSVVLLNESICKNLYYNPSPETLLCFTSSDLRNVCKGDSGGPVVCDFPSNPGLLIYSEADKKHLGNKANEIRSGKIEGVGLIVGINSGGFGCGLGFPSFHTRVFKYLPWINSTIVQEEAYKVENILYIVCAVAITVILIVLFLIYVSRKF